MDSPYHSGEIAVQTKAGLRQQADDLVGMYRDSIPSNVAAFLAQHTFAVLSSIDPGGNVWASPLAGAPGFFFVPDPHEVAIHLDRLTPPLDPALARGELAGLLVMDFDRRLRIRINGTLRQSGDTATLRIAQFYGNCTKYIQRRALVDRDPSATAQSVNTSGSLTDPQRALIARSDTFFIATQHPDGGADASHRGGRPGFVTAPDQHTVVWGDYRGNNMFNTFGNLESDARAGLLFIDFDSGASLQLTGKGVVQWSTPSVAAPTGRSVRFEIAQVRELGPAASLQFRLVERFAYNPPVPE